MKVISFVATLPTKLLSGTFKDNQKYLTLSKFAQGVSTAGDQGLVVAEQRYEPCDVAVMLGWVHEHGKTAPHLTFRQHILDQQKAHGGRVIIADSNLFLYKDKTNPYDYLRYSYDGVFPNTGEYCDSNPDPSRWQTIQRDLQIELKPWRTQGNHILMCLQRNGGWSMAGFDVVEWTLITAARLRKLTDRPLHIRSHPGDKKAGQYCATIIKECQRHGIHDVRITDPSTTLTRDLKHCWAVVNHNSSPAVGAAIEGIPVFVTDPERSQVREIANTDLGLIEQPVMPDRSQWIQRISQFHWSFADLENGRCWNHMKKWATK